MDIRKLSFLHIDDFANYRAMLRSILKSLGIENVSDAKDADTAIEKLSNNQYDVILCDYNLGHGQNGQQLLEELMHRKMLPYGTIFVMVTAENTMNMVMAAVEYRPDCYLNKPFPKEILVTRLKKLIAKKDILKCIYTPYNKDDYKTALFNCNKQMKENPKLALEIGKLKGEIALKAGDFLTAERMYDKALEFRSFEWALFGKASALYQQVKYPEAKTVLEKLLADNPNYIEAYDLLADILEKEGNTQEQQQTLDKATELSPRSVGRQQRLAEVAKKNGDTELAEKALKSSINYGEHSYLNNPANHAELLKLYIDQGNGKRARAMLKSGKEKFRKDKKMAMHMEVLDALLQVRNGNLNRSEEVFHKLLENMPEDLHELDESTQKDLIEASETLGDEEITEALKADIANTDGREKSTNNRQKYAALLVNGKGMRLYQNDKLKEAMHSFEKAARNLPSNISINMNAAQTLIMMLRKNQITKAQEVRHTKEKIRDYLDICCSINPQNEKYIRLEELYGAL